MVNLELYRIFYTVARCGSLTKAAEELYISQPAVSQAIKQLETQLKTPLFNRTHRGMELSAQGGERIFADVEQALRILGNVESDLAALRDCATGFLRIGASETIFEYILSETIVEYSKQYPQVKIELITDVSPKICEMLKTDRCDVGFLNLPIGEDKDIALSDPIKLLTDVFVAGKAFSGLQGKRLDIWEPQKYPVLLMQENTVARASFENYCRQVGVKILPSVEVDSWDFMKRLVTNGMGIGCLPREYAQRRIASGELFELDVRPTLPLRSVVMALPKHATVPFALRAFIEKVKRP